jgi:8-oxo-dGTP diphosphatase
VFDEDQYRDFATVVILLTKQGIPMVREDNPKFKVAFLKFPGGRRDGGETPEECAAREMAEEIGAVIDPASLILLKKENRGSHDFYLFGVRMEELPKLKHVGDEGEDVGIFSPAGLKERRDVFPNHWKIPEVQEFIYGETAAA